MRPLLAARPAPPPPRGPRAASSGAIAARAAAMTAALLAAAAGACAPQGDDDDEAGDGGDALGRAAAATALSPTGALAAGSGSCAVTWTLTRDPATPDRVLEGLWGAPTTARFLLTRSAPATADVPVALAYGGGPVRGASGSDDADFAGPTAVTLPAGRTQLAIDLQLWDSGRTVSTPTSPVFLTDCEGDETLTVTAAPQECTAPAASRLVIADRNDCHAWITAAVPRAIEGDVALAAASAPGKLRVSRYDRRSTDGNTIKQPLRVQLGVVTPDATGAPPPAACTPAAMTLPEFVTAQVPPGVGGPATPQYRLTAPVGVSLVRLGATTFTPPGAAAACPIDLYEVTVPALWASVDLDVTPTADDAREPDHRVRAWLLPRPAYAIDANPSRWPTTDGADVYLPNPKVVAYPHLRESWPGNALGDASYPYAPVTFGFTRRDAPVDRRLCVPIAVATTPSTPVTLSYADPFAAAELGAITDTVCIPAGLSSVGVAVRPAVAITGDVRVVLGPRDAGGGEVRQVVNEGVERRDAVIHAARKRVVCLSPQPPALALAATTPPWPAGTCDEVRYVRPDLPPRATAPYVDAGNHRTPYDVLGTRCDAAGCRPRVCEALDATRACVEPSPTDARYDAFDQVMARLLRRHGEGLVVLLDDPGATPYLSRGLYLGRNWELRGRPGTSPRVQLVDEQVLGPDGADLEPHDQAVLVATGNNIRWQPDDCPGTAAPRDPASCGHDRVFDELSYGAETAYVADLTLDQAYAGQARTLAHQAYYKVSGLWTHAVVGVVDRVRVVGGGSTGPNNEAFPLAAEAMDHDFSLVQVRRSTVSGFTGRDGGYCTALLGGDHYYDGLDDGNTRGDGLRWGQRRTVGWRGQDNVIRDMPPCHALGATWADRLEFRGNTVEGTGSAWNFDTGEMRLVSLVGNRLSGISGSYVGTGWNTHRMTGFLLQGNAFTLAPGTGPDLCGGATAAMTFAGGVYDTTLRDNTVSVLGGSSANAYCIAAWRQGADNGAFATGGNTCTGVSPTLVDALCRAAPWTPSYGSLVPPDTAGGLFWPRNGP